MYFLIIIIFVPIACFFLYQRNKAYHQDYSGEKQKEDNRLKEVVSGIVQIAQKDLDNKLFVNGHYTKQVTLIKKKTTYYSYVILFDKSTEEIELISYNPKSGEAASLGFYTKNQIEAVDIEGINTNYLFKEANKIRYRVQTQGVDITYENDYGIHYSQVDDCNQLRAQFNLKTLSN